MLRQDWGNPMLSVLFENQFLRQWWEHKRWSTRRYTHQYTWCPCWDGRVTYESIGIRGILEEQSEALQIIFCVHRKDEIHGAYVLAEESHRFVGRLSETWVTYQIAEWACVLCYWFYLFEIEILENHRMSRSVVENQTDDDKITCNGPTHGQKNLLKPYTARNRDLNDVLGPLPAIPSPSLDNSSRWSIRRASGCSGIYEEILDPANSE